MGSKCAISVYPSLCFWGGIEYCENQGLTVVPVTREPLYIHSPVSVHSWPHFTQRTPRDFEKLANGCSISPAVDNTGPFSS